MKTLFNAAGSPAVVFAALLCIPLYFPLPLAAQSLDDQGHQSVLEILAQDFFDQHEEAQVRNLEAQWTQLLEQYEALLRRPARLNRLNAEELSRLQLLSGFQIATLLEYRQAYGDIYDWREVAALPGFTPEEVERLRPFFVLESGGPLAPGSGLLGPDRSRLSPRSLLGASGTDSLPRFRALRQQLLLKTQAQLPWEPQPKHAGPPLLRALRWQASLPSHLSAALALESDAGEPWRPDGLSLNLSYQDPRSEARLRSLLVGDYHVGYGQGLLVRTAPGLQSAHSVDGLRSGARGLTPCRSNSEIGGLRGVATAWGWGPWQVELFGSYKKVDAHLSPEGFTSLPSTGYHRTEGERSRRQTLGQGAGGGRLRYSALRGSIALNTFIYTYTAADARRVQAHTQHRNRRLPFGGLSVDGLWFLGPWQLYGEAAWDLGGAGAWAAGCALDLDRSWRLGLHGRWYQAAYTAPFASALGKNSTVSNERGLHLCLEWQPRPAWQGTFSADLVRFPAPTFRQAGPSTAWDLYTQWTWQPRPTWTLGAQLRHKAQASNLTAYPFPRGDWRGRLQLDRTWEGGLSWTARWEGNVQVALPEGGAGEGRIVGKENSGKEDVGKENAGKGNVGKETGSAAAGWMHYQELRYAREGRRPWRLSLRLTYHRTPNWDTRIYVYERDLRYGFSVPALYGHGWRAYAVAAYKPRPRLQLEAKTGYHTKKLVGKLQVQYKF